jgi:predicted small lipoprotein YifL
MAKRSRSVVSTAAKAGIVVVAVPWLLLAACGQKGPLVAAKTSTPAASVPAAALAPVNAPGALLPASGPR